MVRRNKDATSDTNLTPDHEVANSLTETADQRSGDRGHVWSNPGHAMSQSTTSDRLKSLVE